VRLEAGSGKMEEGKKEKERPKENVIFFWPFK
jgi:hypothetical protein